MARMGGIGRGIGRGVGRGLGGGLRRAGGGLGKRAGGLLGNRGAGERLLGGGKLLEAGKKGLEAMGGPQGIVDMVKGFVEMGQGGAPADGGGAAAGAAPDGGAAAAAPPDGGGGGAAIADQLQRLQQYLAGAQTPAELAQRVERVVAAVGGQNPAVAQITREVGKAVAAALPQ